MADLKTNAGQELLNRLVIMLMRHGADPDTARSELYLILHDYTVDQRTEDLIVYEGDKNDMLIQKFIVSKAVKGCTKKTCEMYYRSLRYALRIIGKNADTITPDDLRFYTAQRMGVVSKCMCQNEQRVLSSFFAWMTNEDLIRVNPMTKIDMVKIPKIKRKAFSDDEIERMRMFLRTNRERAIFEILLSTGCRVSELTSIRVADISPDGAVDIMGKGQKMRTVYLNAKARLSLEQYMAERRDANPYLVPKSAITVGRSDMPHYTKLDWYQNPALVHPADPQDNSGVESMMRGLGRRSGVDDVHPHRFRRTCATMALQKGMPLALVSRMLGHENIGTTQIYLDLDEEDLKLAHKRFVT